MPASAWRSSGTIPAATSGSTSTPLIWCAASHESIASCRSESSSGPSASAGGRRKASIVRHWSSGRFNPQNCRVAASCASSWATSIFALRSTADAGLFSSCARPAASRPSDDIFSSMSSLVLNTRARSTITCTRTAVSSWHSWIIRGRSSVATATIVVRSSATTSPGGPLILEYGSIPVTSPACHSITMRGPPPRSTRIERWPSSTT